MCRRADTMNVRTTEVQAAVQQLVMEQGEYAPLELLLATDRLAYETGLLERFLAKRGHAASHAQVRG